MNNINPIRERIMDFDDLKRVNRLWVRIYPYLAQQIMETYKKGPGAILELGPFSGGIAKELARKCPESNIIIADSALHVLEYFDEDIRSAGLSDHIKTHKTAFNTLAFEDTEFDLVVSRGVFFLLDDNEDLLREIFRVLKAGGVAFIGGGFGKDTPQTFINEISDESRVLNDRLGRKRISIEKLEHIIMSAGLVDSCKIVEEGGLWVVIEK